MRPRALQHLNTWLLQGMKVPHLCLLHTVTQGAFLQCHVLTDKRSQWSLTCPHVPIRGVPPAISGHPCDPPAQRAAATVSTQAAGEVGAVLPQRRAAGWFGALRNCVGQGAGARAVSETSGPASPPLGTTNLGGGTSFCALRSGPTREPGPPPHARRAVAGMQGPCSRR